MSGIGSGLVATLSFDFSALDAKIDRIIEDLSDVSGGPMSPWLQKAADVFMVATQQRFAQQGFGGGAWAPLTPQYLKRKLKVLGFSYILVWTFHLDNSLRRGQEDYYEMLLPNGIVFGTSDWKAAFHQYGWTTKNGKFIAPRPIIVDPSDPTLPGGVLAGIQACLQSGLAEIVNSN